VTRRTTFATFATVALAVAAAFLLRVLPSFRNVFTPGGINFQEFDPWFHVRTLQNLLAHFPWRSGFDPYALYPRGENVPTGPFWDYLMASVAWILGAGSPSFATAERVAAWLPAVLGALFPWPVFWLSRRLFNNATGLFAAWWIAVLPGTLLWMGHLGMADHHVAESLTALLALGFTCAAVEAGGQRAVIWTAAAGISLGAFLATRPAGIFVIGILAAAAFVEPALARVTAGVLTIGALLFVPVSGALWSRETWFALGVGIAATLSIAALDALWRRNNWRPTTLGFTLLAVMVLAVLAAWVVRPSLFHLLFVQVRRAAGLSDPFERVQEAQPLLRAAGNSPWQALFYTLGYSWFLALPALAAVMVAAWRKRRPALVLFAVWSAVMTVGAFAQLRMTVYFAVNAAILAGAASAWLVSLPRGRKLRILVTVVVVLFIPANLPIALLQMNADVSPSPSWRQALGWLRQNTPEPLESDSWNRYYPHAHAFAYPPSAYGVAVMWYYGYWVEYLARRIPSSNGTGTGGAETARFYADPDPEAALQTLDRLGSRYVLADSSLGTAATFSGIANWAGRPSKDYFRVYLYKTRRVVFYLPDYYRSMAVRLALFSGQPVEASETWVIHSLRGRLKGVGMIDAVDWARKFPTEQEARDFLKGETRPEYALGGFTPYRSCVNLDAAPGLRLAYQAGTQSDTTSVKVFERVK
jgi:dolichyl-diphosphooligosaccharide--protein glycosyltransferase